MIALTGVESISFDPTGLIPNDLIIPFEVKCKIVTRGPEPNVQVRKRGVLNRKSHYVWGKRYLLRVVAIDARPSVEIKHSALVLNVRPGATEAKKREVLERWYREQIREDAPRLIAKWEPIIGVRVQDFYVRRMKTKWGSCSESAGTIRLNSELAKKPRECLEYIVVHEMVHLLERTHNRRFMSLMEQVMPRWQAHRELLNRLPVRREKWVY